MVGGIADASGDPGLIAAALVQVVAGLTADAKVHVGLVSGTVNHALSQAGASANVIARYAKYA